MQHGDDGERGAAAAGSGLSAASSSSSSSALSAAGAGEALRASELRAIPLEFLGRWLASEVGVVDEGTRLQDGVFPVTVTKCVYESRQKVVTELPMLMRVEYDDDSHPGFYLKVRLHEHVSLFQMDERKNSGFFSGRDASVIRDGRVMWIRAKSNAATGSITWTRPPAAADGGVGGSNEPYRVTNLTAVQLHKHGASQTVSSSSSSSSKSTKRRQPDAGGPGGSAGGAAPNECVCGNNACSVRTDTFVQQQASVATALRYLRLPVVPPTAAPATMADAIKAKQCELAVDSFGRYNETSAAESRLYASRLHLHPMVRLAPTPRRLRWTRREHLVEQLRTGGYPVAHCKYFGAVTHAGATVYIPKFNYPIPELVLRDPLLAKKDLEKCHAAVDAQFAKLEQCLDSNASDGDRHRASAVLDRLISGDGVNAVFQPPALASRKDALPTELQGSLSLRLPPSGHGEPVVGRQPSAGVRLHSSSRAFGAADADDASLRGAEEAVDDGVPGCDCDDGACTCAADASNHAHDPGAYWTPRRLELEPLLLDAIRVGVRDHVQAALRRSSLTTYRVELCDVYVRKVTRVVPRKSDARLNVDFCVCMVPDSHLSTFDGATAVFDVDAILATALLHHQRVHDNYIAELKADHQTAIILHREACARDYSREDAAAGVSAVPAKDDDTDAGSDDAVVGSDDILDDADAAPSGIEMERLWRCEIRESLAGLSVGELKDLCRDNSLRVGGNKTQLQSRLGDWLALQDDLYDGVPAPSADVDDEAGEVVEAFGMTAHAQHRYPPRDPADKRTQLERDMVILLAAQQRELDDLHADHAIRCTLLRLPPISATLKTAVRADAPQPRRQLNAAWLNKKGHLAQYIGLPGPFARTCKVLRALFPLHIGEDCQSSWQGDLLTPLDCALLTKMWLHTGKTMGMLATDAGVPEAVLQGVIRTWLPLWGAAAKVLLRVWLDFDYVAGCMPAGDAAGSVQAELQGRPVSGMPDGKDFETDRWNRNPLLRRLT